MHCNTIAFYILQLRNWKNQGCKGSSRGGSIFQILILKKLIKKLQGLFCFRELVYNTKHLLLSFNNYFLLFSFNFICIPYFLSSRVFWKLSLSFLSFLILFSGVVYFKFYIFESIYCNFFNYKMLSAFSL